MIEKDPYIKERRRYSGGLIISLLFVFHSIYVLCTQSVDYPSWRLILFAIGIVVFGIIAIKAATLLFKLPKNQNK